MPWIFHTADLSDKYYTVKSLGCYPELVYSDCLHRLEKDISLKVLKNFAVLESHFNKVAHLKAFNFITKKLQHVLYWRTSVNECSWYFTRSYWTPPQGFYILMNVYEFLKFSSLGSISQYSNRSWAMHLHYVWLSWQGKKQLSTTVKTDWTKIHFYNLALLASSYK